MADTLTGPLSTFINNLSKIWGFAPPSDNLWTVEIKPHNRGISKETALTMIQLYKNIISVNSSFNKVYGNAKWKIECGSETELNQFINKMTGENKIFLATELSYKNNSVTINPSAATYMSQYTGFLSQGKIVNARDQDLQARIGFLLSNWDINEIFFDPWIAAIGQQGLIEDENLPNIKADIFINEYATSHPETGKAKQWVLRKQITLYEAFPTQRDDKKLSYELEEAGKFKSSIVNFSFRDYSIKYNLGFGNKQ